MFLLDTNVVSELRRLDKAHSRVARWAESVAADALYISVVTVLELDVGILSMERRDPATGGLLRAWMETRVLPSFAGRIVAVDLEVARRCAALHVPDPRPERDALIAATALVKGLVVVTRNDGDFSRIAGLRVVNPWY